MLVLSLARGGEYHVAYGDLSLFDSADAEFWGQAQRLYAPAMSGGNTSSFGGWPGSGEPYGWLSRGPGYAVATVVNPSLGSDTITLPDPPIGVWSHERNVRLLGGQVAVITCGQAGPLQLESTSDGGVLTLDASCKGESPIVCEVPNLSTKYRLVIRQTDKEGRAWRNFPHEFDSPPFKVSLQTSVDSTSLSSDVTQKIWSGLSWWVIDFESPESASILEVASVNPERPVLTVEIYRRQT